MNLLHAKMLFEGFFFHMVLKNREKLPGKLTILKKKKEKRFRDPYCRSEVVHTKFGITQRKYIEGMDT